MTMRDKLEELGDIKLRAKDDAKRAKALVEQIKESMTGKALYSPSYMASITTATTGTLDKKALAVKVGEEILEKYTTYKEVVKLNVTAR